MITFAAVNNQSSYIAMRYQISAPSTVKALIQLPASKSISNRALILNALASGNTPPDNLSDCDDTFVMIRALTQMPETIDIMAAGTAMRFLTAYLSISSGTHLITGTQRMQQRPIQILVNALRELGANIEYAGQEGYPPLRIQGTKLTGNTLSLPGNVSSQYISALLMIAPLLPEGLRLNLTGTVISRPYINLTLQLMKDFGANADWVSTQAIQIMPQPYKPVPYFIESDWSAASYWYQMAALAPNAELELTGLFKHSYQGDSRGADLFTKLGIETVYTPNGVRFRKTDSRANRLEEDLADIPDLAQTFAVTCCLLGVQFKFTGLQTLRIKETDRISALEVELRKLGYILRDEEDSILYWDGECCQPEAVPVIKTYEDHRMAMAFAPAALQFPNLQIDEPQVVTKSYPAYWQHLSQAGFSIREDI